MWSIAALKTFIWKSISSQFYGILILKYSRWQKYLNQHYKWLNNCTWRTAKECHPCHLPSQPKEPLQKVAWPSKGCWCHAGGERERICCDWHRIKLQEDVFMLRINISKCFQNGKTWRACPLGNIPTLFPPPSSSLSGMHLLKGSQETCNQGNNGKRQLIPS